MTQAQVRPSPADSDATDALPESMLVGVLTAPRQLELRQLPVPRPGPGQVLVQIRATALCTWEQRTYLGIQDVKTPFVGGHETSGVVAAVGEGVRVARVGDHVALGPSGCGECYYCRSSYPARCDNRSGLFSVGEVWGPWGLAEYKLVPAQAAFKMPAELSFEEAALSEPVSCVVHSVRQLQPELGDDVVVIGAGPMGLLNTLVLKARGARVIVCELDPTRREKARQMGADAVVDPSQDAVAEVKALTEGRGADAVVAAVGSARVDELAFQLVGKTGKVVLFASAHPSPALSVDHNLIHKNEVTVLGVEGKNVEDFRIAVKLLASRLINTRPLIDSVVPLAQLEHAFQQATRPDTYRVVVTPTAH